jgi:hypothetical protein
MVLGGYCATQFFESVIARDDHQSGSNSTLDRLAQWLKVAPES